MTRMLVTTVTTTTTTTNEMSSVRRPGSNLRSIPKLSSTTGMTRTGRSDRAVSGNSTANSTTVIGASSNSHNNSGNNSNAITHVTSSVSHAHKSSQSARVHTGSSRAQSTPAPVADTLSTDRHLQLEAAICSNDSSNNANSSSDGVVYGCDDVLSGTTSESLVQVATKTQVNCATRKDRHRRVEDGNEDEDGNQYEYYLMSECVRNKCSHKRGRGRGVSNGSVTRSQFCVYNGREGPAAPATGGCGGRDLAARSGHAAEQFGRHRVSYAEYGMRPAKATMTTIRSDTTATANICSVASAAARVAAPQPASLVARRRHVVRNLVGNRRQKNSKRKHAERRNKRNVYHTHARTVGAIDVMQEEEEDYENKSKSVKNELVHENQNNREDEEKDAGRVELACHANDHTVGVKGHRIDDGSRCACGTPDVCRTGIAEEVEKPRCLCGGRELLACTTHTQSSNDNNTISRKSATCTSSTDNPRVNDYSPGVDDTDSHGSNAMFSFMINDTNNTRSHNRVSHMSNVDEGRAVGSTNVNSNPDSTHTKSNSSSTTHSAYSAAALHGKRLPRSRMRQVRPYSYYAAVMTSGHTSGATGCASASVSVAASSGAAQQQHSLSRKNSSSNQSQSRISSRSNKDQPNFGEQRASQCADARGSEAAGRVRLAGLTYTDLFIDLSHTEPRESFAERSASSLCRTSQTPRSHRCGSSSSYSSSSSFSSYSSFSSSSICTTNSDLVVVTPSSMRISSCSPSLWHDVPSPLTSSIPCTSNGAANSHDRNIMNDNSSNAYCCFAHDTNCPDRFYRRSRDVSVSKQLSRTSLRGAIWSHAPNAQHDRHHSATALLTTTANAAAETAPSPPASSSHATRPSPVSGCQSCVGGVDAAHKHAEQVGLDEGECAHTQSYARRSCSHGQSKITSSSNRPHSTSNATYGCPCDNNTRSPVSRAGEARHEWKGRLDSSNTNHTNIAAHAAADAVTRFSHRAVNGNTSSSGFTAVEIIPGLYLGGSGDVNDIKILRQRHISLIINVSEECAVNSALYGNPHHIRVVHFPLKDHSDEAISDCFTPVTRIIHEQLHRRQTYLRMRKMQRRWDRASAKHGKFTDESAKGTASAACVDSPTEACDVTKHHPNNNNNNNSSSSNNNYDNNNADSVMYDGRCAQLDCGMHSESDSWNNSNNKNNIATTGNCAAPGAGSKPRHDQRHSNIDAARSLSRCGGRQENDTNGIDARDGGGVLVYCRMGVSRSATCVLAYLILYGTTLALRRDDIELFHGVLHQEQAIVESTGGATRWCSKAGLNSTGEEDRCGETDENNMASGMSVVRIDYSNDTSNSHSCNNNCYYDHANALGSDNSSDSFGPSAYDHPPSHAPCDDATRSEDMASDATVCDSAASAAGVSTPTTTRVRDTLDCVPGVHCMHCISSIVADGSHAQCDMKSSHAQAHSSWHAVNERDVHENVQPIQHDGPPIIHRSSESAGANTNTDLSHTAATHVTAEAEPDAESRLWRTHVRDAHVSDVSPALTVHATPRFAAMTPRALAALSCPECLRLHSAQRSPAQHRRRHRQHRRARLQPRLQTAGAVAEESCACDAKPPSRQSPEDDKDRAPMLHSVVFRRSSACVKTCSGSVVAHDEGCHNSGSACIAVASSSSTAQGESTGTKVIGTSTYGSTADAATTKTAMTTRMSRSDADPELRQREGSDGGCVSAESQVAVALTPRPPSTASHTMIQSQQKQMVNSAAGASFVKVSKVEQRSVYHNACYHEQHDSTNKKDDNTNNMDKGNKYDSSRSSMHEHENDMPHDPALRMIEATEQSQHELHPHGVRRRRRTVSLREAMARDTAMFGHDAGHHIGQNSCDSTRTMGMTYHEAFHLVKAKKSDINPNIGFVLALRALAAGKNFDLCSPL